MAKLHNYGVIEISRAERRMWLNTGIDMVAVPQALKPCSAWEMHDALERKGGYDLSVCLYVCTHKVPLGALSNCYKSQPNPFLVSL